MKRNQYIISENALNLSGEYSVMEFNGLYVTAYLPLELSISMGDNRSILMIGFAIDPNRPELGNDEIVEKLLERTENFDSILKAISNLTGRFVMLYAENNSLYAFNDAVGLRQAYYGKYDGSFVMTSSPQLFINVFDLEPVISEEKKRYMNLPGFHQRANQWFGDECVDYRLKKILPNHYLDIESMEVNRIALPELTYDMHEDDIIGEFCSILEGTYQALVKRFNIIQPVTAGLDSRILLGASRKCCKDIHYYIFDRKCPSTETDVQIAFKLSDHLKFEMNAKMPEKPDREFLRSYRKEFIIPRISSITDNTYFHYRNHCDQNIINLSGGALAVGKCFYGYTNHEITTTMLRVLAGFAYSDPFLVRHLESFLAEAKQVKLESNIPILDLFYWEQRMGNWGAYAYYENDIAIEEFSPFDNRHLIMLLQNVHPKKRRAPKRQFFMKILRELFDGDLDIPINPDESPIKQYIKSHTYTKYMIMRFLNYHQRKNII